VISLDCLNLLLVAFDFPAEFRQRLILLPDQGVALLVGSLAVLG